MTLKDFWKKLIGGSSTEIKTFELKDYIDQSKWDTLAIYDLALHSGINLLAAALSKCEFRTYVSGKEIHGPEYYLWNYQPNRNQSASQFMHQLVWTIIYRSEALVVESASGELLIADSFTRNRYAFYDDIFSNVTVCGSDGEGGNANPYTFQKSFAGSDVLYFRLNNRNITSMLTRLQLEYADMIEAAITKFYKSGGERGVLNIDASAKTKNYGTHEDGTPVTFTEVYTELINKQFAKYFKSPNAVMPLFSGFDYQQKGAETSRKSTSEVKDIKDLSDEIYDKVANALMIPAKLLRSDVVNLSEMSENFLSFAVEPITTMLEKEINRKRSGSALLTGTRLAIDTTGVIHKDAFAVADKADKMIASGAWSVDEVRKKVGDPEIGEDWSRAHVLTKNYDFIDPNLRRE